MHLRGLRSITIIYIFLILLEPPVLLFLIGISWESLPPLLVLLLLQLLGAACRGREEKAGECALLSISSR